MGEEELQSVLLGIAKQIANQLPIHKPTNGLENARDDVMEISVILPLGEDRVADEHVPLAEKVVHLLAKECFAGIAQSMRQAMQKSRVREIATRAKQSNGLVIQGSLIVDRSESVAER